MRTALLKTDNIQGGTDEVQLDAEEDRHIHGVQLTVDGVSGANVTLSVSAFLGTDQEPQTGGVSDATQHLVQMEADLNSGGGASTEWSESFTFETPFHWDEHVTATLQATESAGNTQVHPQLAIYYTEV